jgi:hypothetical protein
VPLSDVQSDILRTLAAHRDPESYVAGSTPLHRDGPRFSGDIDIFHHREERVAVTAAADAAILMATGFVVEWLRQEPGIHAASVRRQGESTKLEWVRDSDFRFYPAVPDELFGYTLHLEILLPTRHWPPQVVKHQATSSTFSTSMSGICHRAR